MLSAGSVPPPDAGSFDGTIEIKQKNGDPRLKITLHGVGT